MMPMRAAVLLFALSLGACASESPWLLVDDVAVPDARVSAALGADAAGHPRMTLVVVDPGPPNVSDAGASYGFEVDLGFDARAGDVLAVNGVATLTNPSGTGTLTRTFAPNAGHDPKVLSVSAAISCFCDVGRGPFTQTVTGTVEVTSLSASQATLHVDLVVEGLVPSGGTRPRRLHLTGSFTGAR